MFSKINITFIYNRAKLIKEGFTYIEIGETLTRSRKSVKEKANSLGDMESQMEESYADWVESMTDDELN
jgi:hypothetical protein